jgi:hypothetical protein
MCVTEHYNRWFESHLRRRLTVGYGTARVTIDVTQLNETQPPSTSLGASALMYLPQSNNFNITPFSTQDVVLAYGASDFCSSNTLLALLLSNVTSAEVIPTPSVSVRGLRTTTTTRGRSPTTTTRARTNSTTLSANATSTVDANDLGFIVTNAMDQIFAPTGQWSNVTDVQASRSFPVPSLQNAVTEIVQTRSNESYLLVFGGLTRMNPMTCSPAQSPGIYALNLSKFKEIFPNH